MRRIDRKGLRAPALVLDLELTPDGQPGDDRIAVGGYETLWCLSRAGGVPREISFWDVTGDTAVSVRELRDRLNGTLAEGRQFARAELALVRLPAGARVTAAPPLVMQRPPLLGWQTGRDMTSAGGPANPQIPQGCFVDVSFWSTSSPPYYDYGPQPALVDVNGVLASYLARLMR